MLRNTSTKLGELRKGDRFYFITDSKRIAHQVTSDKAAARTSYNIVNANGSAKLPFDKQAPNDKPVIFLRHTIPVPGEECRLYDLQQGDIFFFPNNVVTEFIVLDTKGIDPDEKYLVDALKEADKRFWKGDTTVFYVGKAEF